MRPVTTLVSNLSNSTLRCARHLVWFLPSLLLGLLVVASAPAADATLSWDSLSGEQQYTLVRLRSRWEQLDVAGRRALLERAANFKSHSTTAKSPPAVTTDATNNPRQAPTRRERSQRRRTLTAAQASLSAHSFRLRRVLRDMPGLGAEERRDLLARWGELSNSGRIALLDRYSRNVDDNEEIVLQKALRDGRITPEQLQRGLASGKLRGADLKAALSSGRISASTIQEGIATGKIYAEDLEKGLRGANIDSSDLRNAIEQNRLPEGTTRASVVPVETVNPPVP